MIDLRLLHFLRVQWQCDWKSKIKNQNFFFWAITDLKTLFEYLEICLSSSTRRNLKNFFSQPWILSGMGSNLNWIRTSINLHSCHGAQKNVEELKKVIRFSSVLFDKKVCILGFLNVILGNITQFFYGNILSYKRGIVQISNTFQFSRHNQILFWHFLVYSA